MKAVEGKEELIGGKTVEGEVGLGEQESTVEGEEKTHNVDEKVEGVPGNESGENVEESRQLKVDVMMSEQEARAEHQDQEPKEEMQIDEDKHNEKEDLGNGQDTAIVGEKRKREEGDDGVKDSEVDMEPIPKEKRSRIKSPSPSTPNDTVNIPSEPKPVPATTSTASVSIPPSLSHTIHPPTRSLYISGFRRPLQTGDLISHLEAEGGELDEDVAGGCWVDGIKSHCYATVSRSQLNARIVMVLIYQFCAFVIVYSTSLPTTPSKQPTPFTTRSFPKSPGQPFTSNSSQPLLFLVSSKRSAKLGLMVGSSWGCKSGKLRLDKAFKVENGCLIWSLCLVLERWQGVDPEQDLDRVLGWVAWVEEE